MLTATAGRARATARPAADADSREEVSTIDRLGKWLVRVHPLCAALA